MGWFRDDGDALSELCQKVRGEYLCEGIAKRGHVAERRVPAADDKKQLYTVHRHTGTIGALIITYTIFGIPSYNDGMLDPQTPF